MKKITRIIFLCFATGIFFFQMYNSIQKYVSFPIITANSLVSVKDIDLPITYICQVLFYSVFFNRKKVLFNLTNLPLTEFNNQYLSFASYKYIPICNKLCLKPSFSLNMILEKIANQY